MLAIVTPLAASRQGAVEQLPRQPDVGLMIWTFLAFLVTLFVLRKYAWPAITEALDKRQQPDRGVDRHGRAHAGRGRRAARGVPRAAARGAHAGRGDRRPRTQGRRGRRARVRRGGPGQARGAARADPPRHRGRDAPRDPGDPHRGRRPDDPGHREGDPQDARRRRPEAPRRGGARRARLQLTRRGAQELGHGGDRPGLRAVAVRGGQGAGQARPRPRAARRVRRRARRVARAADVLLLALLLDGREAGRPAPYGHRRRRELPELPLAAAGEPPHAGHLPRAPRVRPPVARGQPSPRRSRSRAPSSSIRRSPSASATRSAARPGVPWS